MADNPNEKPSDKEIEELKEVMKKIQELQEEQKKNKHKKGPRRPMIAIEFGGVFHHNRYFNFVFTFIVNFTFMFFILELYEFAIYYDILYLVAVVLLYTFLEETYRTFVLMRYFKIILKTFGTIFYFGYLLIFFIIDQYIVINDFNFVNGTLLAFFVLIFTIVRYIFGTSIRRYFRKKRI